MRVLHRSELLGDAAMEPVLLISVGLEDFWMGRTHVTMLDQWQDGVITDTGISLK